MGGWGWDEDPPSPRDAQLFENARRVYDRIGKLVTLSLHAPNTFTVTRSLVCEFHGIATAGEMDPRLSPGILRTEDVQIGRAVVQHEPPPWQQVPSLLDEACAYVVAALAAGRVLHAAAYALWRINWIHPFGDGNGKTSRAVMYVILCVGYGQMLPGTPALPDLIARNPYAYYDALDSADDTWKRGTIDVSEMESLLATLLERQVQGATLGPVV